MAANRPERVIIVGGGLVGTVWAMFLARRGYRVEIYEQRPDPRVVPPAAGRSTHLVLSHRGWKSLAAVGVEPAIRALCLPIAGREVHPQEGERYFVPYGQPGESIWAIDRARFNVELIRKVSEYPEVTLHFEQRCEGLDVASATLRFRDLKTGELSEKQADLIFGVDGAFSKVRQALTRLDRYNYSQEYFGYGYKELSMTAGVGATDRVHIWPRSQLMLSCFPNPGGDFTATLLLPFGDDTVHPSASGGGNLLSFQNVDSPRRLRTLFERYFPDALPLMPNLAEEFFSRPTASILSARCYPWTHGGRIALLGDAAHTMAPFFGQGVNSGFEDCQLLDGLLDSYGMRWDRALREYERSRKPNADAVTDLSTTNFVELSEKLLDPVFLLRRKVETRLRQLHPEHFMPLYAAVAFTSMPYLEVRARARRQDTIVTELLRYPDIEKKLESPELKELAAKLVLGTSKRANDPQPLEPFSFEAEQK